MKTEEEQTSLVEQITKDLEKAKFEPAISSLLQLTEGTKFHGDAVNLSQRFYKLSNERSKQLISQETFQIEMNKLTFSCLELIENFNQEKIRRENPTGQDYQPKKRPVLKDSVIMLIKTLDLRAARIAEEIRDMIGQNMSAKVKKKLNNILLQFQLLHQENIKKIKDDDPWAAHQTQSTIRSLLRTVYASDFSPNSSGGGLINMQGAQFIDPESDLNPFKYGTDHEVKFSGNDPAGSDLPGIEIGGIKGPGGINQMPTYDIGGIRFTPGIGSYSSGRSGRPIKGGSFVSGNIDLIEQADEYYELCQKVMPRPLTGYGEIELGRKPI